MVKTLKTTDEPADEARLRILEAATRLIRTGGLEAATTRSVAAAASVQVPTIYRLFGDMRALRNAAAEHGLAAYIAGKVDHVPHLDPVDELRRGWNNHVAFGLENPGLFSILSSEASSPAAEAVIRVVRKRVHEVALQGRLWTSEECAVAMLHATCIGTVLLLVAYGSEGLCKNLSSAAREAIIEAITIDKADAGDTGLRRSAATLHANLGDAKILTRGERALLEELLTRLATESE